MYSADPRGVPTAVMPSSRCAIRSLAASVATGSLLGSRGLSPVLREHGRGIHGATQNSQEMNQGRNSSILCIRWC